MNFRQIKEQIKDKMYFRKKRLQARIPLPFPMVINIELTNKCTENCIWCPRDSMTRERGFMEFDVFKKIIDEIPRNQKLRRLYVHWMGEPLLHPEFLKFIEYAKSKDKAESIVIATNGFLLSKDVMKRMIELKIDELFVAIDAVDPGSYSEFKNTDHFNIVKDNIVGALALKREVRLRLPFIRVKFLETDQNFRDKDLFRLQWRGIADSVFFEKDLSIWDGKSEKVNKYIKSMGCYLKHYGGLAVRYPCDRLWYLMAVQWNGIVSPCVCDWNGENGIGDIRKQRIEEIWYSDILMSYRSHHINRTFEKVRLCSVCTRWGTRNMGDWLTKHKRKALSMPQIGKG